MNRLLVRMMRLMLRNAIIKQLARGMVARVPYLRRRAHILAQEAMRRVHYDSCVPFTVDDLSPRSARCLAELTRTRDSHH